MEVTNVELVRCTEPVALPEPWLQAWREPDPEPIEEFEWSLIRVHTDEGITGIGPGAGDPRRVELEGFDPFRVEAFWEDHLSGGRFGTLRGVAGVEIALWDLVGKAAGLPIYRLLGASRDRVEAYAATTRLLDPDHLVDVVREVRDAGFGAVKLRLHRPDPEDDLEAVRAVREAVGEDCTILVDANQNNASEGYDFWSRRTAMRMAKALDDLGVGFVEEPLPRRDVEGLAEISDAIDADVAGGEHSRTVYDFEEHLRRGAYDVLQPDVMLAGNMGIGGLRKTATVADFFDRPVIPHVLSGATFPFSLAATLHVAAATDNVPMVEYGHDPPILTPETTQRLVEEPLLVDDDGHVAVPDGPGLGLDFDEDEIEANSEVVWSSS